MRTFIPISFQEVEAEGSHLRVRDAVRGCERDRCFSAGTRDLPVADAEIRALPRNREIRR